MNPTSYFQKNPMLNSSRDFFPQASLCVQIRPELTAFTKETMIKLSYGFEITERKFTHLTVKGVRVHFAGNGITFLENCHFPVRQIISE